MIRFLTSTAFSGAAFIRERRLIDGHTYSDMNVYGAALIRGQCLFEARCLFKEIR